MLGGIFSRNVGVYYVIMLVLVVWIILFEIKQMYHKIQKEKRVSFYNSYVNEVFHYVDLVNQAEIKTSNQVKSLTQVLKMSLKKTKGNLER